MAASWVKLQDDSYIPFTSLRRVFVQQHDIDGQWYIHVQNLPGDTFPVSAALADQAAAQAALDNAIAGLGGSV
jgi:hypothetical protein